MNDDAAPGSLPAMADHDWLLASIVRIVTKTDSEIILTLQVGGFLVSGHLVSSRKYIEGFGADMSAGFPDKEEAAEVRDSCSKIAKEMDLDQPGYIDNLGGFIHLRNAKLFGPGGSPIPSNHGVWWRGRLSEVQGFFLGSLSITPNA